MKQYLLREFIVYFLFFIFTKLLRLDLEMVESIEVKEMAMRAKLLKETLLYEVGEFYKRWSEQLTELTQKHKLEQKNILTKGKAVQNFWVNLRICQINKNYIATFGTKRSRVDKNKIVEGSL